MVQQPPPTIAAIFVPLVIISMWIHVCALACVPFVCFVTFACLLSVVSENVVVV